MLKLNSKIVGVIYMKRKIITSLSVILVVLGMIIVKEPNLTLTKLIIDKVDVKTANVLTTGEYITWR